MPCNKAWDIYFKLAPKISPSVPMAEYRPYVGPGSHLAITPTSICKWGFVLHSMAFQGWALICCPLCSPCIISVKVKVRRWRKIKLNIGFYPKQSAEWITAWLQPGGVYACVHLLPPWQAWEWFHPFGFIIPNGY